MWRDIQFHACKTRFLARNRWSQKNIRSTNRCLMGDSTDKLTDKVCANPIENRRSLAPRIGSKRVPILSDKK
jgi:hypothetical protein